MLKILHERATHKKTLKQKHSQSRNMCFFFLSYFKYAFFFHKGKDEKRVMLKLMSNI